MIYLSGKISGLDRTDYLEIFDYYEKKAQLIGDVINPAKTLDTLPELCYHQYMRLALDMLSMCNTIYLLPNWYESQGAREEVRYAISHNYNIITPQSI